MQIASTDGAVIAAAWRTGLLLPHIQHHVFLESTDFGLPDQQCQLFIVSIEETSFPQLRKAQSYDPYARSQVKFTTKRLPLRQALTMCQHS